MRRNDDNSCERPRCRWECTLTYLGTRLCQRHWIRLCGQQDGDERATEFQAACPGHLDLPLTTCVSAHSATYLEGGRPGRARRRDLSPAVLCCLDRFPTSVGRQARNRPNRRER